MGLSEIPQVEGGFDSDNRKWVISGIALRAPLKSVYTRPVAADRRINGNGCSCSCSSSTTDAADHEECSTTPSGEESRIQTRLTCPPAPRKRKPSLKYSYGGRVKEFFSPPDLETVFVRHV